MSQDQHEHEDVSVGIAVRFAEGAGLQVMPLGEDQPGIHLAFVDHSQHPPSDPAWGIDPDSDFGLQVSIAGLDPEVASQLLHAAAQFIEDSEWEVVDE